MTRWDLEMRSVLQGLLRQGYTLTEVVEEWRRVGGKYGAVTVPIISTEVKRGLTPEQHKRRRYVKYDICRAYQGLIGADAFEYIQKNRIEDDG